MTSIKETIKEILKWFKRIRINTKMNFLTKIHDNVETRLRWTGFSGFFDVESVSKSKTLNRLAALLIRAFTSANIVSQEDKNNMRLV